MPIRRFIRLATAVLAVVTIAAAPARADYAAAVAAFEAGDYESARRELRPLALQGNARAQIVLGVIYKDGLAVEADPVAALGWFFCAANGGGGVGADAAARAKDLASGLDGAAIRRAKTQALACRQGSDAPAGAGAPAGSSSGDWSGSLGAGGDAGSGFDIEVDVDAILRQLSEIEIGSPGAVEAPKFDGSGAGSFFLTPKRENLWSKAFFLPADGTVVGSQQVAWELGADELYRDLRTIARSGDDILLGVLALVWWLIIAKTLYNLGAMLLRIAGIGNQT